MPTHHTLPTAAPSLPASRYSTTAIALHWLLGAALIAVFAVGIYMADLPFSPRRLQLYNWHKWAGVAILLLVLAINVASQGLRDAFDPRFTE